MNERRIARRTEGHVAATTPIPPRPDAGGEATGRAPRLARSLQIERTWSHAQPHGPESPLDLDRFEAALAFAIEEAERLRQERRNTVLTLPKATDR